MASKVVDIVVDFTTRNLGALEKAKLQIRELNDGVRGAQRSWADYTFAIGAAAGAVAGAYVTFRKFYDTLKEGAELITTSQRFDKLTRSIGTTADTMLTDLRAATRGMMSDAELMASASQMMSLKLAATEDQVIRLTTVAGVLGWDMQQLILTFANLSKMRLDALGLSVEDVVSRQRELMKQGMSEAMAFKEAVIQAGEARLEIGGLSETELALKQLETAAKNAGDAFKVTFSSDLAGRIRDAADGSDDLATSLVAAAEGAALLASKTLGPVINVLIAEGNVAKIRAMSDQLEGLGVSMEEINAIRANAPQNEDFIPYSAEHLQNQEAQIAALGRAISVAGANNRFFAMESANSTAALLGLGASSLTVAERVYYYNKAQGMAVQANGAVAESTGPVIAAMGTLTEAEQEAAAAAAQLAFMQAMIVATYGDYAEGADKAYRAVNRRTKTNADIIADMKAQAAALTDVMNQEFSAVTGMGGGFGMVADSAEEAASRIRSAFDSEIAADAADGLIDEAGLVNLEKANDLLYQQASAAGASAMELALLGIATGKFSEEQAKAALKAAVLQEAVMRMAKSIASGQLGIEDAVQQVGDIKVALDASQDMGGIQAMIAGIESDGAGLNVDFIPQTTNVRDEMADIDGSVLKVWVQAEMRGGVSGGDRDGDGTPDANDTYSDDPTRRQLGGRVFQDKPYLVGEAGPELFVPWSAGTVISNTDMRASNGGNMSVTINISGSAAQPERVGSAVKDALNSFWSDMRFEGVSW